MSVLTRPIQGNTDYAARNSEMLLGALVKALTPPAKNDAALHFRLFNRMICDPKQVKLAIYDDPNQDWSGAPHWLPHEGGESLDQLKTDAYARLDDGKPTDLERIYLEAALDAIDYFEQQRRNRG